MSASNTKLKVVHRLYSDDYDVDNKYTFSVLGSLNKKQLEEAKKKHKVYEANRKQWGGPRYKSIPFDPNSARPNIFSCYLTQSYTCCGFFELGRFQGYDGGITEENQSFIAQAMKKWLDKHWTYTVAYTPDKKEWKKLHEVLEEVGFVPVITLPSTHNDDIYGDEDHEDYNNIKWEWFNDKESKGEKAVSTLPI